jgi:hypothetical protein
VLNQGLAATRDRNGNIYVAGAIRDESSNFDVSVVKYNADGRKLWATTYAGPAGSDDTPAAVEVDTQGRVAVFGSTTNASSRWLFLTVQFDASGTQLWSRTYDSGDDDTPSSFKGATALDSSGNLYVTGWRTVIKYASNGDLVWAKSLRSNTIALDGSNRLWLTSAEGTILLDAGGRQLLRSPHGGLRIVARNGFVWLSSTDVTRDDNWDYRTSKLDSKGALLWTKTFDGGYQDMAQDLAVDSKGNAYVTGSSEARYGLLGSSPDYLTVKYDPDGREIWTARKQHTRSPQAIAIDDNGGFVVTGIGGDIVRYREVLKKTKRCRDWDWRCRFSR